MARGRCPPLAAGWQSAVQARGERRAPGVHGLPGAVLRPRDVTRARRRTRQGAGPGKAELQTAESRMNTSGVESALGFNFLRKYNIAFQAVAF